MSILSYRTNLRPIEYPWVYEVLQKSYTTPWNHQEIPMGQDVQDWNSEKLTGSDKKIISGILQGFTLLEQLIGDYWSDVIAQKFPKPEIIGVARSFASQEVVHMMAYDHLEASLGLSSYKAYLEDPVTASKLDQFTQQDNLGLNLALFSGIGEGVSLFGSFAVLLSFCRTGLLKGVRQILSYSVSEENAHSEFAAQLYLQLVKEYPEMRVHQFTLWEAFQWGLERELDFISQAFADGNPPVTFEQIEDFLRHRVNKCLRNLGYEDLYNENQLDTTVKDWFYPLALMPTYHDFFSQAKTGSNYSSSITQDFENFDFDFE
jgi:ribonucleoside-diphosphate reductase beta chain